MATIIVEDGSIVPNANSYVSEADLTTYATDRGITLTAATDVLIINAMDYIESLDFIGYQLTEDQPLSWPRGNARKDDIYWYDTDEIPQDLIDGLCETCIAIDQGNDPSSLVERATKREKVGDLEVEYMDSASSTPINRKINNKLKDLVNGSISGASFVVSKA